MLLGLDMAMRHDHGQLPTHAHIMVIGWVSFAIFGLFYFVLGETVPGWPSCFLIKSRIRKSSTSRLENSCFEAYQRLFHPRTTPVRKPTGLTF